MAHSRYNPDLSKFDRALVSKAMRAPMLEKDHELVLATRWRDKRDQNALAELTQAYLRLVISMAGKFKAYGLPIADLIQEGTVGLMEAASRFEPTREIRFSTYARWWVRSSIQDYVLRNWSIVRTGTTSAHKSLFFNLRRLRARIEHYSDAPMDIETKAKIAETLNVRVQDVDVMEARLSGVDGSLNTPVGEEPGLEWQDYLPCDAPLPDDVVLGQLDQSRASHDINQALDTLTPREAYIIRERHLNTDLDAPVTLSNLGRKLSISKERVRQIEAQAMGKLRLRLKAAYGGGELLYPPS